MPLNPKTKETALLQKIERGFYNDEQRELILQKKASELFPLMTKTMSPMELELFNDRLQKRVN